MENTNSYNDIVKRYPLAYLDGEIGVESLHQHSQPGVLAVADYERTGQGQHRDLGRGLSRWRSSHPVSFQADEGDGRRGAVSRFNWPGSRFQVVSETQPFSSSVLPPTTLGLNSLISLQHQNQTGLTTTFGAHRMTAFSRREKFHVFLCRIKAVANMVALVSLD